MNSLIEDLVLQIIKGIKIFLESNKYLYNKKSEEILRIILLKELTKPSIHQSKTPTQIVNEFLNEEFNEEFNLTPANFGEEAHNLIIEWGVQKAKDISEQ